MLLSIHRVAKNQTWLSNWTTNNMVNVHKSFKNLGLWSPLPSYIMFTSVYFILLYYLAIPLLLFFVSIKICFTFCFKFMIDNNFSVFEAIILPSSSISFCWHTCYQFNFSLLNDMLFSILALKILFCLWLRLAVLPESEKVSLVFSGHSKVLSFPILPLPLMIKKIPWILISIF